MNRTFRQFKFLEPIGKGTTGSIYRAVQTTLDRPVAIKELHPHLSADPDFIARFEREAKTAATLQHENIVAVIDYGREVDSFYIALEFVDGSDIDDLIERHGKLPLPVALTLMGDMMRGLEHAHRHHVVHRDVKPANVLLSKDGTAKIADFSIAHAAAQPSMTMTGATLGTPAYMSPEQVGGRPVDARTDLFSAAVMFFEMVTGSRPFSGESYASIIGQLLTVTPESLSKVDPSVPESIARVVRRALEKDRDRRYADAGELGRAFESAARAEKVPLGRDLVAALMVSRAEYDALIARRPPTGGVGDTSSRLQAMGAGRALPPRARMPAGMLLVLAPIAIAVVAFLGWRAIFDAKGRANVTPAPVATGAVAISTPVATSTATPESTATATAVVVVATATPVPVAAKTATARATRTPVARTTATTHATLTPVARTTAAAPTATPRSTAVAMVAATPLPTPAAQTAAPRGFVKVRVNPGSINAQVHVDGKLVGETPMPLALELSPGPHTIVITHPQYRLSTQTITVKAGETLEHKIKLEVP